MSQFYVEPEENEANDGYIWSGRGRDLIFAAITVGIVFTGVVASFLATGGGEFIAGGAGGWLK